LNETGVELIVKPPLQVSALGAAGAQVKRWLHREAPERQAGGFLTL
jgi:hypothetical protein